MDVNPADVVTALALAKTAFETAKSGLDALKALIGPKADPVVKEKLRELQEHLLDAKDKVLNLREAMQALKEENLALKEKLDAKEKELNLPAALVASEVGYILRQDGVWEKGGRLYCPKCHAISNRWSQLAQALPNAIRVYPLCNFTKVGH